MTEGKITFIPDPVDILTKQWLMFSGVGSLWTLILIFCFVKIIEGGYFQLQQDPREMIKVYKYETFKYNLIMYVFLYWFLSQKPNKWATETMF